MPQEDARGRRDVAGRGVEGAAAAHRPLHKQRRLPQCWQGHLQGRALQALRGARGDAAPRGPAGVRGVLPAREGHARLPRERRRLDALGPLRVRGQARLRRDREGRGAGVDQRRHEAHRQARARQGRCRQDHRRRGPHAAKPQGHQGKGAQVQVRGRHNCRRAQARARRRVAVLGHPQEGRLPPRQEGLHRDHQLRHQADQAGQEGRVRGGLQQRARQGTEGLELLQGGRRAEDDPTGRNRLRGRPLPKAVEPAAARWGSA